MNDPIPRELAGYNEHMTIQEIQRLKAEKPFHPFRILTLHGREYEVPHPECLGQTPSGRFITIGMPDDSTVTLDLSLVTGIRKGINPQKDRSK
jgi:hypothetical protein